MKLTMVAGRKVFEVFVAIAAISAFAAIERSVTPNAATSLSAFAPAQNAQSPTNGLRKALPAAPAFQASTIPTDRFTMGSLVWEPAQTEIEPAPDMFDASLVQPDRCTAADGCFRYRPLRAKPDRASGRNAGHRLRLLPESVFED